MPDPNPRRQLVDELVAERHRPVPPAGITPDWPGVGEIRAAAAAAALGLHPADFDDEGTDPC